MSDEIEAFKEGAKAAQEIAKTTGKAIDATSALGRFVAKMLGTVPEDVVGLAGGDYIRIKRMENLATAFLKAQERLASRGVEEPDPIDLKYTQPLLEAVSEESDETLQEMWANLIANVMDPNHPAKLQRIFIETVRQLEPPDAKILNAFYKYNPKKIRSQSLSLRKVDFYQNTASAFCETSDLFTISVDPLKHLGLLEPDDDSIRSTALGRELLRAVEANVN